MSINVSIPRRAASLAALAALAGCQEPEVVLPASLDGPVEIAVSQGRVCMDLVQISEEGLFSPTVRECEAPELGAIGLVASIHSDRLGVIALDDTTPRLVDLDLATPGVTHIPVGDHPISVATSPTGEVAYTANQVEQTLSVVNLWAMAALPEPVALDGAPRRVATRRDTGDVVVALSAPSRLVTLPGFACDAPDGLPAAPGELDPAQGCAQADGGRAALDLDGQLQDMVLDPVTAHAYVIYGDRAYLSVVALDEQARAGEACLGGVAQAPCEVARVGLATGCADGLDNDGDGLADQLDPQCYGPLHAESAEGVGRRVQGACADGLDNDGDGAVDRDDEDCHDSAQASEDAADTPPFDDTTAACSDGYDNDGDGLADASDPDCYGPRGRSERAAAFDGFEAIGIDEIGALLYITQTSGKQVLVVDARGRRLIDAPRSGAVPDPFTSRLGVVLGRTPTPTAVDGHVRRRVIADPRPEYDDVHALIAYDLGAHVTADNGFVYYVDVATIYCDLWELGGDRGRLTSEQFYRQPELLAQRNEGRCLTIPALPLAEPAAQIPSCEAVVLCRACVEGGDDFADCSPCQGLDADAFEAEAEACKLDGRLMSDGLARRTFNPRMKVLDFLADRNARQVGRASCDQPEALISSMQLFLQDNPERSAGLGCGSPLMPQPLSLRVPTAGPDAPEDFNASARLDLLERRELQLVNRGEGLFEELLVLGVDDYRIAEEEWTITYEGVLPGTSRADGLIDAEDPSQFDIGAMNPCLSDVREGDQLILRTAPGTETDGVPPGVRALRAGGRGRGLPDLRGRQGARRRAHARHHRPRGGRGGELRPGAAHA